MTAYTSHSERGFDAYKSARDALRTLARGLPSNRGLVFGALILLGLASFETFNFSTTEFALADLLGGLSFAGVRWATILALAFCSIDFAGIARLMTPQTRDNEPIEVWYLLGAWFLGATMNAVLTWWSVSLALINHSGLGNEVLGREALLSGVPVFIAGLVWLIRVLLIGTLTLAGDRLFSQGAAQSGGSQSRSRTTASAPAHAAQAAASAAPNAIPGRPSPRTVHTARTPAAAKAASRP